MKRIELLLMTALAVLAPAKTVLMAIAALCAADLVTGLAAALKERQKITSRGLKRSLIKLAVYEVGLACAFLAETYLTGPELPAMKLVAALAGVTELKSILENLDRIGGQSLYKALLTRLDGSQSGPKGQGGGQGG